MKAPASTYRVQLSPDFPFEDLRQIVDYLHVFGISTIYSAPFFQAREGSTHGYDIIDPYKINRQIGTLENFRLLSELLKTKDMTWLQDIVPNHMAYDGANPWLRDIFEIGPDSRYYNFFDIDWDYKGWKKVMAPFLGAPLEEILQNKELELKFDGEGFSINYFDNSYPASARSYSEILKEADITDWKKKLAGFSGNDMEWKDMKTGFYRDVKDNPNLDREVEKVLEQINDSEQRMKEILDLQYFIPTYWKATEQEINYRRFFTINGLICLRMEDPEVFETYHHYIFELCRNKLINGLRIDHIDGLLDPAGYTEKLSKSLGQDFYVVVEKILEWKENLPSKWPVEGTSGYDFLAEVNHLFTETGNEEHFTREYQKISPKLPEYEAMVYEKKLFILKERMGGELHNLWNLLKDDKLLPQARENEERWKDILSNFLAAFPVYRIYPEGFPLREQERKTVDAAFRQASEYNPEQKKELESLRNIFLGEAGKEEEKMFGFLHRCQQFTGPLAAKGVEDTSFYIYNRLVSHNEVGDSPENFGITIDEFHKKMLQRQKESPRSINATATHDTKRGEDARMRLNVLSEIPGEWFAKIEEWNKITQRLRKDPEVPGSNETYFIFQTLLGAMPFREKDPDNFLSRTTDYLQKVLREAKVHSNWADPDESYEGKVFNFIEEILKDQEFRKSFDSFHKKIAHLGAVKSLGQALIKVTAPGIPDIYQGTEMWDLSYVDPDNRRPVDYDERKKCITAMKSFEQENMKENLEPLTRGFRNGRIKMYTLHRALNFRRSNSSLFEKGKYLPLELSGEGSKNFIAYARNRNEDWCIVLVPVLVSPLCSDQERLIPDPAVLEDIRVTISAEAPGQWENLFTGESISIENETGIKELFSEFPVALLKNKS